MKPLFEQDVQEILPQVIAWRRHFHQQAELSFKEEKTTQFLIDEIEKLGNVAISRPAATGLVARLVGASLGPVIALRADIDALAMPEMTGLSYASQNSGIMHACGHDAHTAMLLGALTILSKNQKSLRGEFVCIFQHAEEKPPGGAIELVTAGVLDGVDAILGQHISSILNAGHLGLIAGPSSANSDCFTITVKGRGGHASSPNLCIDPLPAAIQIVTAMQQITARRIAPLEKAVLSVTQIHGGTADNIIPDTVTIGGTVRTYKEETQRTIYERICAIATHLSEAENCCASVDYTKGYPSINNTPEYVDALSVLADAYYGEGTVATIDPSMGGEDFSYYLEKVPGCMMYLGVRNEEKGCIYPAHNTRFTIDEAAFSMGVSMLVHGALQFQQVVSAMKKL
ncbi:MAG: amidohydrolase [Sporomusaceae bacterium]|nr:amidohydrolase [Sporomusaceae bacterium]